MFLQEAVDIISELDIDINYLTHTIRYCKGTVFTCGNGGSGATSSHFTSDLMNNRIKSVCLNDNIPYLTSVANDYGYEHIFSKSLLKYDVTSQNILVAFTCSGTSLNILNALLTSKAIGGMPTIVFTAFDMGKLVEEIYKPDILIHVPTNNIYLAEGIHSLLTHAIIDKL